MLDRELTLPQTSLFSAGPQSIMASAITDDMHRAANDVVSFNLTKADAMLAVITGAQHEAFAALSDDLQSNYLWVLNDLIQDARRAREIETAGRTRTRSRDAAPRRAQS